MNHIHHEYALGPEDAVTVALDNRANVMLLDDENYRKYRSGKSFRYHGGSSNAATVTLEAPHPGTWHLVVDLGGYPGSVNAQIEVERAGVAQQEAS